MNITRNVKQYIAKARLNPNAAQNATGADKFWITQQRKDNKGMVTYMSFDLTATDAQDVFGRETDRIMTNVYKGTVVGDAVEAAFENGIINAETGASDKNFEGSFDKHNLGKKYMKSIKDRNTGQMVEVPITEVKVFVMAGDDPVTVLKKAVERIENDDTYRLVPTDGDVDPSAAEQAALAAQEAAAQQA